MHLPKNRRNRLPYFLQDPKPDYFLGERFVVFDFETTIKSKGSPYDPENELVLTCWVVYDNGNLTWKYSEGSEFELQELWDDIESADFAVAHNTAFELGWLNRGGWEIHNKLWYCTMVGEKVRAGNRAWMRVNLADTATRYGVTAKDDRIAPYWSAGIDTPNIPFEFLLDYCFTDVRATLEIFLQQRDYLRRNDLLRTQFGRCILTPVLVDISSRGMALDKPAVKQEYDALVKEKAEIEDQLAVITGGINPRSSKQVCDFLYGDLGFEVPLDNKGNRLRKANKTVIAMLTPETKEQKQFLELKDRQGKVDAALSKTLKPFMECVADAGDNEAIIQFLFSQISTDTHRLSSTGFRYGAQGQNIPRKYKRLIKARHPGWKVGEGDGSQLEFRVAAELGNDELALSDITNGTDVHSFTAAVIFGKKKLRMAVKEAFEWISANHKTNDKAAELRQNAKPFTFRPLYGGGDNEQTNGYCDAFRAKYHQITATQEEWKQEVLRTKKLRTRTGLIFYWPDTKLTASGYITNSTAICNYPVQQLATAEIIPVAVTYLWSYMRALELQSFLTNTIHDSAISEVHPNEVEIMQELYQCSFIEDVYFYFERVHNMTFTVPLGVDFKVSTNWNVKDLVEKQAA